MEIGNSKENPYPTPKEAGDRDFQQCQRAKKALSKAFSSISSGEDLTTARVQVENPASSCFRKIVSELKDSGWKVPEPVSLSKLQMNQLSISPTTKNVYIQYVPTGKK